jgi:transcriptional regulator with GAF, ATPase, and Fis domain
VRQGLRQTRLERLEALDPLLGALSASLDIRDVFEQVAAVARLAVPHDFLSLGLFSDDGWTVRLHALSDSALGTAGGNRLSPEVKALMEQDVVIAGDVAEHPDPSLLRTRLQYPGPGPEPWIQTSIDPALRRLILENGVHSMLYAAVRARGELVGGLLFHSRDRDHFEEEDAPIARRIANCVGLALAHERLAEQERDRRRRQEALAPLLPALATALDIRTIFKELSRITQDVIPHDNVTLGLYTEDRRGLRIHAISEDMGDLPEYRFADVEQSARTEWKFYIVRRQEIVPPCTLRLHPWTADADEPPPVELELDAEWAGRFRTWAIQSQLRVPVRLRGRIAGGLTFHSRTRDLYSRKDVELAVRVADHVALALAHQELAEEAHRSAEAKERAARLETRVQVLAQELQTLSPHRALGRSRKWRDVLAQATKVAPTDTTVLLTGESGTGKEVVARFIHRGSSRKDGPFVALNCAALPEQLLESELFGHEKGAFTGAQNARPGKIEQAQGGVLFLDEVGEMSPAVQAKFLRVLQEKEYQRLGGTRTQKADTRVLAATNRNLKAAIAQGSFREDLFYRLAVFDIALPPLRERPEDVLLLVDAFLEEIGRSVGRPAAGVSEEVREKLVAYPWPGNVRELRNALERAVILCEGGLVTSEHLPIGIVSAAPPPRPAPAAATPAAPLPASPPLAAGAPGSVTLEAAEREMILQALARAGNNKSKAARLLGLTRAQLRSRIEKHGLTVQD